MGQWLGPISRGISMSTEEQLDTWLDPMDGTELFLDGNDEKEAQDFAEASSWL